MEKLPGWYRTFRKPRTTSGIGGQLLDRLALAPLQAMIAVAFGDATSDSLLILRDGIRKLVAGKPVVCNECGVTLFKNEHDPHCAIYQFAKPILDAAEPFDEQLLERKRREAAAERRREI